MKKRDNKTDKFKKDFIAFGNRRDVFGSITFATILLTLLSLPIIVQSERILNCFLIIWIVEIAYILLYLNAKGRRK